MGTGALLKLTQLSKRFGGVTAVSKLNFELSRGEILGVIGPNGSGKTTVANLVTGFIKQDSGEVYFKGMKITGLPPHRIADLGLTRTFQIPRPFHLPSYKNLIVPLRSPRTKRLNWGRLGSRFSMAMDLLEEVGFERDAFIPYKIASSLPEGYLKRLELARCLCLRPDLIIADEILSGLSMAEMATMIPLIEKLQLEGVTIIMIEHRLRELFSICKRVMVMNFGIKIAEGHPQEVMAMKRVKEAYLGKEIKE